MIESSPPPPSPSRSPDPNDKLRPALPPSVDTGCTNNSLEWKYRLIKWTSFACAIMNCLCAGSILLFSLWAPVFQQKLGYSQMQVNAISIAGELGMYLPVPIFGYICDAYGPAKLSLISSVFFGPAYILASHTFSNKLPYPIMVLAFVFIGMGTSSMYFAGVTTSAKNFTGNRGLALSLPIAAFGLSSLWQSQVVSRVFTDKTTRELGISTIFLAYAVFLLVIGILGALGLKVIKSAEEISRTGERESLLEGGQRSVGASYGTTVQEAVDEQVPEKRPLINKATWEFLTDNNMWFFAAGVFLVTGPGEAFINNMGTLITTLYPPPSTASQIRNPIDPATHVSIVAATSTIARVVAGILSDYLAPPVPTSDACPPPPRKFPRCSRMCLLFLFAFLMLLGNLYVSLGYVQENGENFWIVSSSIGAGYGAVFCLAPTVVSVVWGTENFGTNWGIVTMTPAVGATVFGSIFAWGYDHYADKNGICWGEDCYSASFMVMVVSVACALVGWSIAWKGPSGWSARGITV